MRKIGIYIISFFLLFSCKQPDSFVYDDENKINFVINRVYFPMGELSYSEDKPQLNVDIEILGFPAKVDRTYRIQVDETKSTAKEGRDYEISSEEYVLKADESITSFPIKFNRRNLDDESLYLLKIDLVPNENFELGIIEMQSINIEFTNRIDMPKWWSILSKYIGEYNIRKYQKFIEINDGGISEKEVNDNPYAALRIFKQVKEYFEKNQTEGIYFPDIKWPV